MISRMSPRLLGRSTAAARVLFGVVLLARPELLTVPWIGRDATRPGSKVLAQAVGARDLALGAGALACDDAALAPWLAAALLADGADLAATVAAGGTLPLTGRLVGSATALGGVVLGATALAGLRR
ncbi:MAG: hypothetical protein QOD66_1420 [Solirubrobacteraceae bacterium]|jgi:hypothetical protein|nr:hypothetical protein [Solirubrobacteraceae bacterium]